MRELVLRGVKSNFAYHGSLLMPILLLTGSGVGHGVRRDGGATKSLRVLESRYIGWQRCR